MTDPTREKITVHVEVPVTIWCNKEETPDFADVAREVVQESVRHLRFGAVALCNPDTTVESDYRAVVMGTIEASTKSGLWISIMELSVVGSSVKVALERFLEWGKESRRDAKVVQMFGVPYAVNPEALEGKENRQ